MATNIEVNLDEEDSTTISKEFCAQCVRITLARIFGLGTSVGVSADEADARTSNKWRIEFSEGANADGVIMFRVTPIGGQPS